MTSATGYDLALVTTDPGAGQARNRTARAIERTVPFQLACQAIANTWYATAGHHPADIEDHRDRLAGYPRDYDTTW